MMELTQSAAGDPEAASEDPTLRVRTLPVPPGIGGRGEHVQVGAALADPPQVMALAEAMPTSGPSAVHNPAGAAAEHRVLGGKDEHVGAKLGADRAE